MGGAACSICVALSSIPLDDRYTNVIVLVIISLLETQND